MKRLRKLLALGLIASVVITVTGCALHIESISAGLMRKSKADSEAPKPAPPQVIAAAPVTMTPELAKALVCSGRFTDRELLQLAATDPLAPVLILTALRSCDVVPFVQPPLKAFVTQ